MKIKEFSISRYGPLDHGSYTDLGNFNLLFGWNEEGKTLTIDALIKMLVGKASRGFDRINRVEEEPEGYILLEKDGPGEIKLPRDGTLTTVTGLTAYECRNIFVIRDSDLAIANEGDFYKYVTDRLVGLKTEEIDRIIGELRHTGHLTRKGDFQDTPPLRLGTRMRQAMKLMGEIDNRQQVLAGAGFEQMENELRETEQKLDGLENEPGWHETAEKKEKLSAGREALDSLCNVMEACKDLSVFNRDDEQKWQEYETVVSGNRAELNLHSASLEEESRKLERYCKSKETEEFLMQGYIRSRDRLEEDLKPRIAAYQTRKEQFMRAKSHGWGSFLSVFGPLSILSFLLSTAGMFLWEQGGEWFFTMAILTLAAMLIYAGFLFRMAGKKRLLDDLMKGIIEEAGELKFKAETPAGVLEKIDEFSRAGAEKNRKIRKLEEEIALCRKKIDTLNDEMEKLEAIARDAEEKIKELKENAGVDTLQEYQDRLRRREEHEREAEGRAGVLTDLFGVEDADDINTNISFWREIIALPGERLRSTGGLVSSGYDGDNHESVQDERYRLRNRKQELVHELEKHGREMEILGREINTCLAAENEYISCRTTNDLRVAREKLQRFISTYQQRRAYTHAAINILEQIGAEEEKKVQDLFGPGSAVSKYFARITDNLYTEVSLNRENGMIEVLRSDGQRLNAWQLSGGAYDQLYLCIRISLGEKLLSGKKGFFILDDPFLKSDTRRLVNQINFLRDLAAHGWQVIFFTAKDEVKTVLAGAIERGEVRLIMM